MEAKDSDKCLLSWNKAADKVKTTSLSNETRWMIQQIQLHYSHSAAVIKPKRKNRGGAESYNNDGIQYRKIIRTNQSAVPKHSEMHCFMIET